MTKLILDISMSLDGFVAGPIRIPTSSTSTSVASAPP
jgi:hypothetical protein